MDTVLLGLVLASACRTAEKGDDAALTDTGGPEHRDGDGFAAPEDCDDDDASVNGGAVARCNDTDDHCDGPVDDEVTNTYCLDADGDGFGNPEQPVEACFAPAGTSASCAAIDCTEIQDDDSTASNGTHCLDIGGAPTAYACDGSTDGGGRTLVGNNVRVWGTSYDTSCHNAEGFTGNEVLFEHAPGSEHAHCTCPSAWTGCNNLGVQVGSQNWGCRRTGALPSCGMSTMPYTSNTSYIGGCDFVIDTTSSTRTIRLGTLEGLSNCTKSDTGNACVDIWFRR